MAYFNPRSSCEERLNVYSKGIKDMIFQSTLLMRGATAWIISATSISSNFNPRSSCEERPHWRMLLSDLTLISIHAPHARSDEPDGYPNLIKVIFISIHAPHARSDLIANHSSKSANISIHAPHARSDNPAS